MNARSYLSRTFISALTIVLVVIGINAAIDPYGITGAPRVAHINQYKVDVNNHTHLMKKYHPQAQSYNALVTGNSRVEMGLDPAHTCFAEAGLEVYNLGMPGAGIRTQLLYALNHIYQEPVDAVFMGLDFTDFITTHPRGLRGPGLLEKVDVELKYLPSGELNPSYPGFLWLDYYKSLFSLDALISSVRTVVLQNEGAADRDDSGFNPARDFDQLVRIEGPRALFDQKMLKLHRKYSNTWHLRDAAGELHPGFGDLEAFLNVARQREITVYLFTNPFHDAYWQLLASRGLMPLYEDWMASLDALVSRTGGEVFLWDFALDSRYIHEVVPEAGVKSGPLQWFWEPTHYRRELGDYMINTLLSATCEEQPTFGNRLH